MSKKQLSTAKNIYKKHLTPEEQAAFREWIRNLIAQSGLSELEIIDSVTDNPASNEIRPIIQAQNTKIRELQATINQLLQAWKRVETMIDKHLEPLNDYCNAIQGTVGSLKTYTVAAVRTHTFQEAKPGIEHLAKLLGELLADADVHNRAVGAWFKDGVYINFARSYELRDAALNFVNLSSGDPTQTDKFLALVREENSPWERLYSVSAVLEPTRNREREDLTIERAKLVKQFRDSGEKVEEAVAMAKEEWDVQYPEGKPCGKYYTEATFQSDYYKIKNEGGFALN